MCGSTFFVAHERTSPANNFTEEYGDLNENRRRRYKGCSDEKKWTKNRSKVLRMEGEEYLGYSRDSKGTKFKVLHDKMRPAREIDPRCVSEFCKKSKLRACDHITDEERKKLFLNYWKNMSWEQRKQYVISHVELCPKKQVKTEAPSRRINTKQYFLTISSGRIQVCMHTFLNTFGIKEWTVRHSISTSESGMAKKAELTHKVLEGHSKKHDISFLKDFFDSLPKMPSRYCRASSARKYLEPIIESKNHLYKIYRDKCSEENRQCLSRWSFDRVLQNKTVYFNLKTTSVIYAVHIEQGMHYLGQKNIVHRDLAARNILVVDENHIKISDFGLAQAMGTNEYYILKTNRELPIKWYAPESLRDGKFSVRSDVWSFGVTMCEMFNCGEEPKLANMDEVEQKGQEQEILLNALATGARFPSPPMCPQAVYIRIIYPCWHNDPHERPSFSKLISETEDLLTQY